MRTELCARIGLAAGCIFGAVRPASALELAGAELRVVRAPGAENCPDENALGWSVAALGNAPNRPMLDSPWFIEVTFTASPSGYAATIRSAGHKPGVRELNVGGDSCANLAEATSVALAVLLDIVREAPPAPSPAAPPPAPTPAPPPTPKPIRGSVLVAAGITSGLGYGLLGDAASPALGGRLVVAAPWLELLLGGAWLPNRDVDYAPGSVEVGLTLFRADGCLSWEPRPRSGPGVCMGLALGPLSGKGSGFDEDYGVTRPWFAAAAGFFYRLRLTERAALRLGFSALIPLQTEVFSVTGSGQAFETPPVAALFELGPELTIW